jgi:hypothetical protein
MLFHMVNDLIRGHFWRFTKAPMLFPVGNSLRELRSRSKRGPHVFSLETFTQKVTFPTETKPLHLISSRSRFEKSRVAADPHSVSCGTSAQKVTVRIETKPPCIFLGDIWSIAATSGELLPLSFHQAPDFEMSG